MGFTQQIERRQNPIGVEAFYKNHTTLLECCAFCGAKEGYTYQITNAGMTHSCEVCLTTLFESTPRI